jgi:hypothetical protein
MAQVGELARPGRFALQQFSDSYAVALPGCLLGIWREPI